MRRSCRREIYRRPAPILPAILERIRIDCLILRSRGERPGCEQNNDQKLPHIDNLSSVAAMRNFEKVDYLGPRRPSVRNGIISIGGIWWRMQNSTRLNPLGKTKASE